MGRGKSARSVELVRAARVILEEIHPATVRACCYRLFVTGLIPNMSKGSTSRVSKQLTWAREARLIPWSWIVDEGRDAKRPAAWDDPAAFAASVSRQYRRDNWRQQPVVIEVWSEKGTMRGTLAPVLHTYGVTFRVMHGFTSSTQAHDVAQLIAAEMDRRFCVFYCGDWDPSGLYMSDVNLPIRLAEYGAEPDDFTRLALTADDVRDPALPSFPVSDKTNDPRYRWFVDRFGTRCWELDALSPAILRDRLEAAIREQVEPEAWHRCAVAEAVETESLRQVLTSWPSISGLGAK